MNYNFDFQPIGEALDKSKAILILTPANPSLDSVASALSLYLSLRKQEKNVLIACPSPMTVSFNHLIGVNKVTDKLGGRNLVISFDYLKDSIEKVSYNIENQKFNLVIEARPGFPSLDKNKVEYSYSGSEADLVFIIGALKLEHLGKLYFEEKRLFDNALTVNIDTRQNNDKFGQVNFVDEQFASCSEIISLLIQGLNLPVDQDIATNLLSGIDTNTSNFQSPRTSPASFEIAAWCLQNQAQRKKPMARAPIQPPAQGAFIPSLRPSPGQASPVQPQTAPVQPQTIPANTFIKNNNQAKTEPPPDWLKPKIYKGTTKV